MKKTSLLVASALLASSALFAQDSVTSNAVGYVTLSAADGVDAKFGVPMVNAAASFTADSVSAGTLGVSSDASAFSASHYVQFTSGVLSGQWFQVQSASASEITVSEDLAAAGAAADDTFDVRAFWTLSSLFGTDFPVSTNVFGASAQVILNDVSLVGLNKAPAYNYAYHDGSSGFVAAGWFDVNNPFAGNQDAVLVAPNSFITIRNQSGSAYDLVVAGAVPASTHVFNVTADSSSGNDNLVYNPYPAPIQLSLSALTDVVGVSTNVFGPGDQVIVYGTPSGLNPSPSSNYAYHDGSSGFVSAGWFDANNAFAGVQDTVTIPAGGAFLIRKAAGSTDGYWEATLPYSL